MPTFLITGATRGIGRAVAEILAAEELVLVARDRDALDDLAAGLPRARPLPVDLAEPSGIAAALERGGGLPPRLDGVVHSAGILVRGRVAEVPAVEWSRQMGVNVVAVAELTRLALPALRAAGGTVVLVNSGAGLRPPGPGGGPYGVSKHALRAFADGLRAEEPGVRVTSVYPGRTATDMQRELRAAEGGEYREEEYLEPRTVAEVVVSALTFPGRAALPDVSVGPR